MQTDRSSYHVFLHGRELRTPDGRSGTAPTAGQGAPPVGRHTAADDLCSYNVLYTAVKGFVECEAAIARLANAARNPPNSAEIRSAVGEGLKPSPTLSGETMAGGGAAAPQRFHPGRLRRYPEICARSGR